MLILISLTDLAIQGSLVGVQQARRSYISYLEVLIVVRFYEDFIFCSRA